MKKDKLIELRITDHAIEKYCRVTGCQSKEKARKRLTTMFYKSEQVQIDPKHRLIRLLNNMKGSGDLREAKYYEFDRYRMVIIENDVMITFEEKYPERNYCHGKVRTPRRQDEAI